MSAPSLQSGKRCGGSSHCLPISRATISFSSNFGRFPGDQTLNTATVSLLPSSRPHRCLVTESGPRAPLGKAKCLVVANGLRTGHNRVGAPSTPLSLSHPSSPRVRCMGTRAPRWTRGPLGIVVARPKFISTHLRALLKHTVNPLAATTGSLLQPLHLAQASLLNRLLG